MTSTPFDVVVFDFDGTLVQSAAVKRNAFFEIFPDDCSGAVEAVLGADPDGSRHRVIPAMLARAEADGADVSGLTAAGLVAAYGERVGAGVRDAPAVPGAVEAIGRLSGKAEVHLFSMTPHDELAGQVERRNWTGMFASLHGHPHRKPDVLAALLARRGCAPERVLVVGDGKSDEAAARQTGCDFLKAVEGWPERLMARMGDRR